MSELFKKLNLKDQKTILIFNAPESFGQEIQQLEGIDVVRDVRAVEKIGFSLSFSENKTHLDAISAAIAAKAEGDAILWFAYPKGTSKKYQCDYNRDQGWEVLIAAGFRPIRQVSIDQDWSALRFRRNEYIRSLNKG